MRTCIARCPATIRSNACCSRCSSNCCESLTPPAMRGVVQNLRHRFETASRAFHRSGRADTHVGILVYTVAQIAWSRLTAGPCSKTEDLIEASRARSCPDRRATSRNSSGAGTAPLRGTRSRAREVHCGDDPRCACSRRGNGDGRRTRGRCTDEFLAVGRFRRDGHRYAGTRGDGRQRRAAGRRRRLSCAYDFPTASSARSARHCCAVSRPARRRVAAQHQRHAAARVLRRGARRARPTAGRSVRGPPRRPPARATRQLAGRTAAVSLERVRPHADCALAFLIDCSGSMKTWIDGVALMVDTLARAGDAADLATKCWASRRSPGTAAAPGRSGSRAASRVIRSRLNETAWCSRTRIPAGGMRARALPRCSKADLFREGVDGEAVEWACARLARRRHARSSS